MDKEILLDLVSKRMPFGKYKDRLICDLPVSYLEWFNRKGFPKGKIGMWLQTMHVIKTNGLEDLLKPLRDWLFDVWIIWLADMRIKLFLLS